MNIMVIKLLGFAESSMTSITTAPVVSVLEYKHNMQRHKYYDIMCDHI